MDAGTRALLVDKLGSAMVANAELAAVNTFLVQQLADAQAENARLKAALEAKPDGEGLESNGAALNPSS